MKRLTSLLLLPFIPLAPSLQGCFPLLSTASLCRPRPPQAAPAAPQGFSPTGMGTEGCPGHKVGPWRGSGRDPGECAHRESLSPLPGKARPFPAPARGCISPLLSSSSSFWHIPFFLPPPAIPELLTHLPGSQEQQVTRPHTGNAEGGVFFPGSLFSTSSAELVFI